MAASTIMAKPTTNPKYGTVIGISAVMLTWPLRAMIATIFQAWIAAKPEKPMTVSRISPSRTRRIHCG